MHTELYCRSNFTFLLGASHADELFREAARLGYQALAITDDNSFAGIVRAHIAAKEHGVRLIVGTRLTLQDSWPLVVWPTSRAGYGRLCRLITEGRRRAPKGACRLSWHELESHAADWLAGLLPPADFFLNRSSHSPVPASPPVPSPAVQCHRLRDLLGPHNSGLLLPLHQGPDDQRRLEAWRDLSRQTRLSLIAAGDVRYHIRERLPLYDVVTAIRLGTTVDQLGGQQRPNAEYHLRSPSELRQLYRRVPEALDRAAWLGARCRFSLDELRYEYPEELAPAPMTPAEYLTQLTWRGAHQRYPQGIPPKVEQLLGHELNLIEQLRYEPYFLTVFDLVRFARHRGILCQGRGSAANSAVCYCLGITSVDPARTDVLFERFVSRERNEAPDIDVDFEHERREEVLQYLYDKYGRDRAGMTAVVITYRSRSAIRDVGKALGLSWDKVDTLAKNVEGYHHEPQLADRCQQAGIDPDSNNGQRLITLVNELIGFPRHLSQHVGGMVMTQGPLCELTPIENAAMEGRTVVQWDKDDLDELGILKVDCLSLGMLSAIRKCFEMIRTVHQRELTLANIPPGDPQVYDMICDADTMGVFQIESRAQMSMLPRLRPRCYYDLVIEVAIVRPGPIQGQMVHPYLRRRAGQEQATYPNDAIREVLHKTLGVPIFQEQAMRLAMVAAGFTPGEADQLRRAMGAWRRPGLIDQFRRKLLTGMTRQGLTQEFAEQVFQQIRGFGEYGFPESHAASFALLVYVSAWLKHYYPAEFTAALINSQPMGFYAPAQLVQDARQHGVEVLAPDINHSDWDCTIEARPQLPSSLRLGFRMIVGLPQATGETIRQQRAAGPFQSLADFTRRTQLSPSAITRLADADAFASLGRDRRQAVWEAMLQEHPKKAMPLFDTLQPSDDPIAALPPMDLREQVFADYRTAGLSLKAHPVSFYRDALSQLRVKTADQLPTARNNCQVRVAGIVLLRQRPSTAKGITFVTLEDETGTINLVVKQPIWEQYYSIARRASSWIAYGKLERRGKVIHVVVNRLLDLAQELAELQTQSRDFR